MAIEKEPTVIALSAFCGGRSSAFSTSAVARSTKVGVVLIGVFLVEQVAIFALSLGAASSGTIAVAIAGARTISGFSDVIIIRDAGTR